MKKIISILMILALLASSALLVGCTGEGNDDPSNIQATTTKVNPGDENLYTVTLVDEKGVGIADASVLITDGASVFKTGKTDADGKFSIEAEGSNLGVMIVSLPTGYESPEILAGSNVHAKFDGGKSLTITVKKESVATASYTITLLDQNGDPVVGAKLQLCPNGTCLADQYKTNESGSTVASLSPGLPIDVKITELPAGYTMPEELANGYHGKIEAGQYTVTIKVTKG